MTRITDANLEHLLDELNEMVNGSTERTISDEHGWRSVPGMYVIDRAYGGVKLCQYANTGGAESEIVPFRMTKRELYYVLCGMVEMKRKELLLQDSLRRISSLEEQIVCATDDAKRFDLVQRLGWAKERVQQIAHPKQIQAAQAALGAANV